MEVVFIEAHNAFNWGKFMVGRFSKEEWLLPSVVDDSRTLLRACGWTENNILVMDLQTGEGAMFHPRGFAKIDLDTKHHIWVCPLYSPFLTWLYAQDLSNLSALPTVVELKADPALAGYRRQGKNKKPAHSSVNSSVNSSMSSSEEPKHAGLTGRQRNIIRRMAEGETYFSKNSPRMTQKEADDLWDLGYQIQSQSAHGTDTSGGRIFYAMGDKAQWLKSLQEDAEV